MIKNKKLMIIFSIFMLSTVFLVGCSQGTAGDNLPIDEPAINNTENPIEDSQGTKNDQNKEEQTSLNSNGILKSFDKEKGMITLITESNDELTLKVTDTSKVLINNAPMANDQLSTVIGAEVSVEYDAEANTVKTINIKGK